MVRGVSIDGLIKAYGQFEEYRQNLVRKQDRAGAIQAFEYTYETSWKTIRRILKQEGIREIYTPKDCFREAARSGLISDPKIWFEYLNIRNLTVHTYNENMADEVVEIFESFSSSVNDLIENIKKF